MALLFHGTIGLRTYRLDDRRTLLANLRIIH
jgi:hypothetical protein